MSPVCGDYGLQKNTIWICPPQPAVGPFGVRQPRGRGRGRTAGEAGAVGGGDDGRGHFSAGGPCGAQAHAAGVQRFRLLRGQRPELHIPTAAAAQEELLQPHAGTSTPRACCVCRHVRLHAVNNAIKFFF